MKRLELIHTPTRFYPSVGGVEKYVYDLTTHVVSKGASVRVVCAKMDDEDNSSINGVNVKRLKSYGKIANTDLTLGLFFALWKLDFDLINTYMPTPWSADISLLVAKLKRKPLVLTYHNDILKVGSANIIAKLYNNTFLKILLRYSDKIIITQKNYLRHSLYLQKYSKKIITVPIGVNVNNFKLNKSKRNKDQVFFLSVLDKHHRYKGLDYLLKAIAIVSKEHKHIKLYIGGDGELMREYQLLAKELTIEKHVQFLGRLSDTQVHKYYKNSQVFVLPSISYEEGFGIVLLEAMAYATSVITTPITGASEDIDKYKCGLVVEPKNEIQLAEAIIKIVTNRKLATKFGLNGRKLINEKYNWDVIGSQMMSVYKTLV